MPSYKIVVVCFMGLFLISCVGYNYYSIPQLIPQDYNCAEHPGFISESNPMPFESGQHYINRKSKAIQKQTEEVCD